jgi:hypothetical protein
MLSYRTFYVLRFALCMGWVGLGSGRILQHIYGTGKTRFGSAGPLSVVFMVSMTWFKGIAYSTRGFTTELGLDFGVD